MADKKISDFTAATTLDVDDIQEVETVAGNSRKVRRGVAGGGVGTAFPGSPTNNDRFYRTDLRHEYFYEAANTRWLSTQQFTHQVIMPDPSAGHTATSGAHFGRSRLATVGLSDILIEDVTYHYILVGTGNWDVTLRDSTGVILTLTGLTSTAGVGSRSSVNLTRTSSQSAYVYYTVTENSGTAAFYVMFTLTYRLIAT